MVYDVNGHNDDYGFGRVNANRTVHLAAQRVPARSVGADARALARLL